MQKAAVRSNASKTLQLLSETRPELLLPHWDYIVGLLASGNGFAQYPAIHVMANLAAHETEGRWERAFDAFYDLLECDSVMVAGHVAGVSGQVATGQPALRERIAERLLAARYSGLDADRRDLVRGYALDALGEFAAGLPDLSTVVAHARELAASPNAGTRKKANAFLKRFGDGPPSVLPARALGSRRGKPWTAPWQPRSSLSPGPVRGPRPSRWPPSW